MSSALADALRRTAEAAPDAPAVTFLDAGLGATSYRFRELFERAEAVAAALAAADADPDAPLGLLLRSQHDQVLHYLGALLAGRVKLNRDYYLETTSAVLARCGFGAVVTDVDGLALAAPVLEPFTLAGRGGATPPGAVRLDAPFLQFSSGTTGIKRGVVVGDDAVLAQLATYGDAIGFGPDDVIVSWLPLYHDMGFIACLNLPLRFGAHVVMLDPIDWVTRPALFVQAASRYGATLAWNPNFAYAFMAQRIRDRELDGVSLASFRGLANCSEPVTHSSEQRFRDRFEPAGLSPGVFWGCYAMAETTFALTHGTAADPDRLDTTGTSDRRVAPGEVHVSVGRPLPGVELAVVDPEEGRELGERALGELWVRSPFTFAGYFNDPHATAAAFVDGWYRTGDLGYRVGDAFFVAGRRKDVMIVGGVNVFPADVEDLVGTVEGVASGRVSAFSDFDARTETERVTVLFEALPGADVPAAVLEARQLVLAAFQIANFDVHAVPAGWLVKSSSGKMARGANRSKWTAEPPRVEAAR
jgi:fatty-acyl-CoA synthase